MRHEVILIILVLLTTTAVAKELPIPKFTPDDCDCAVPGLYLTNKGDGGSGLTLNCLYEDDDDGQTDFLNNLRLDITSWYDPEETMSGLVHQNEYFYERDKVSCNKNEKCVVIKDSTDSSSVYWIERTKEATKRGNGNYDHTYSIRKAVIYGQTPLILIHGHWITPGQEPKDSEVISIVESLESCAKAAIDSQDLSPEGVKGKITIEGRPIKHATIFIKGDEESKATTDEKGAFSLNVANQDSYTVIMELQYEKDDHTFFRLIGYNREEPVKIRFKVDKGKIDYMYLDLGGISADSDKHEQKITDEIRLEDYFTEENAWIALPIAYNHFTEVLEYYQDELNVDLTKKTLDVLLFRTDSASYQYDTDRSWINIATDYLEYYNEYRPFVFYHEFSHYVQHMLTGKTLESYIDMFNINHGGYANPNTGDSYSEGFAAFMPTVIANHYGRYWASEIDKRASLYPLSGSLEIDWQAWERQGKVEEYAIAGILWDLMDGKEEAVSDSSGMKVVIRHFLEEYIADYDMDKDKSLDRLEFVFAMMMGEIDSNYDDKLEARELKLLDDDELEEKILESKDKDGDGVIKVTDLWDFLNEEKEMILGKLKEALGDDYSRLPESINVDTLMQNIADRTDDDSVDLTFEQVWDIIRKPHTDFTSVYDAFVTTYPSNREEIDNIFIKHGFFIETSIGNGTYDKGEPFQDKDKDGERDTKEIFADLGEMHYDKGEKVGTASNADRKDRKSFEPLEGEYVRVNKEVPFYEIEYVIFGGDYFGLRIPSETYTIRASNKDGLIYVPVAKDCRMTIRPVGVETENPLVFSSTQFELDYTDVIDEGNFAEHEFEYSGDLPEYAALEISEASSSKYVIASIIIVFLLVGLFILKTKGKAKKKVKKK